MSVGSGRFKRGFFCLDGPSTRFTYWRSYFVSDGQVQFGELGGGDALSGSLAFSDCFRMDSDGNGRQVPRFSF